MGRVEGQSKSEAARAYLTWYRGHVNTNARLVVNHGRYTIETRVPESSFPISVQRDEDYTGGLNCYYVRMTTGGEGSVEVAVDWNDSITA